MMRATQADARLLSAGGMAAAIAARHHGPDVLAADKERPSTAPPRCPAAISGGPTTRSMVLADYPNAAAWAPTSVVPRPDGTLAPFPHFVDRGKPGVTAVLRTGGRFLNEANSHHDFVQAMVRPAPPASQPRPSSWSTTAPSTAMASAT